MATMRTLTGGVLLGMAATLVAFKACAAEKPKHEPRTPPQLLINTNPLPKDSRGITSFAPVVKSVAPSVVTISTTTSRRQS